MSLIPSFRKGALETKFGEKITVLGLLTVHTNIKYQVDLLLLLNKTGPEFLAEVIHRGFIWKDFFLSVGRAGIVTHTQKGRCQENHEFNSALWAIPSLSSGIAHIASI